MDSSYFSPNIDSSVNFDERARQIVEAAQLQKRSLPYIKSRNNKENQQSPQKKGNLFNSITSGGGFGAGLSNIGKESLHFKRAIINHEEIVEALNNNELLSCFKCKS